MLTTPATAPNAGSHDSLVEPFERRAASTVGPDGALGLRDPFEPASGRITARRRAGRSDLRDPFRGAKRLRMAGPARPVATDLRSPFVMAPPADGTVRRPEDVADLRDPFGR